MCKAVECNVLNWTGEMNMAWWRNHLKRYSPLLALCHQWIQQTYIQFSFVADIHFVRLRGYPSCSKLLSLWKVAIMRGSQSIPLQRIIWHSISKYIMMHLYDIAFVIFMNFRLCISVTQMKEISLCSYISLVAVSARTFYIFTLLVIIHYNMILIM